MREKTTHLIAFICAIFTTTFSYGQLVTSVLDDGSDGTLRQEIADTPAGGTITFAPSVTTVNLNAELAINKELTINGTVGTTVTIGAIISGANLAKTLIAPQSEILKNLYSFIIFYCDYKLLFSKQTKKSLYLGI